MLITAIQIFILIVIFLNYFASKKEVINETLSDIIDFILIILLIILLINQ